MYDSVMTSLSIKFWERSVCWSHSDGRQKESVLAMSLPRNQTTNNKLKGHSLHTENPQILSTGDINCETKKKKTGTRTRQRGSEQKGTTKSQQNQTDDRISWGRWMFASSIHKHLHSPKKVRWHKAQIFVMVIMERPALSKQFQLLMLGQYFQHLLA